MESERYMQTRAASIKWFEKLAVKDVPDVGGKNAALGEMIRSLKNKGIQVPDGFATTASAYREFVEANNLKSRMEALLEDLERGKQQLASVGRAIRQLFLQSEFPHETAEEIRRAYRELSRQYDVDEVSVAVRSSATAEDLPDASFAGQQETYLNVMGEQELLEACRKCYASLFTDRAIAYRTDKGFDHLAIALSVGVQKMVRSDIASSGVIFTIDPDTGFPRVIVINSSWGLGESVVQGVVNPDEFVVFKPLLGNRSIKPILGKTLGTKETKLIYAEADGARTVRVDTPERESLVFSLEDDEVMQLSQWAFDIEEHFSRPMDIEWTKDGETGELFIVQARPETVQSRKGLTSLKTYALKERGTILVEGLSIGSAITAAKANVIENVKEINRFQDGAILVTKMTDPDWVPIMKRAAGIITDLGGRTSHAAIVSRELGIPAVVGTGNAVEVIQDGQEITLSCAEDDVGHVYDGILPYQETDVDLTDLPETRTKIMLNIASPAGAFGWWRLPAEGIGLARMEFIINNIIKVHPMALIRYPDLKDREAVEAIRELSKSYEDKSEYFVHLLSDGIAKIAAAQYPYPVIVRMSDFKTNEYANLIGGEEFEPKEENPMLGFRGASRYYSDLYKEGFALECRAIKRAREEIGLSNILIMIPFCRSPEEADKVFEVLEENGLRKGDKGLEVYVMAEVPSNITLADQFATKFDGLSIGSNDLTQLVLGVDRDSAQLAGLFDENHEAIRRTVSHLIKEARRYGRKVGICGQAPSDFPEFAVFLVKEGIDSISLNPDTVVSAKQRIAQAEKEMGR